MPKPISRSIINVLFFLIFSISFSFLASGKVQASDEMLITTPVADAVVFSTLPSQNYGGISQLEVAYSSSGATKLSFIKFDLTQLPANAQITQGRLYLYKVDCGGDMSPNELKVGQVTTNWKESTINWTTRPNFYPGDGRPGTCNQLTWWSFDVTSIVENWHGGQTNYGFAIYSASTTSYYRVFLAREYGGIDNQPQMEIYYTLPEDSPSEDQAAPDSGDSGDDSSAESEDSSSDESDNNTPPATEPTDRDVITEDSSINSPVLLYLVRAGSKDLITTSAIVSAFDTVSGEKFTMIGDADPNLEILIFIDNKTYSTTADNRGYWTITIDTGALDSGTFDVQAQAVDGGKGSVKASLFILTNTNLSDLTDSDSYNSFSDIPVFAPLANAIGSTLLCLILICCCPLLLILLLGILFLLLKRKKKNNLVPAQVTTEPQTPVEPKVEAEPEKELEQKEPTDK